MKRNTNGGTGVLETRPGRGKVIPAAVAPAATRLVRGRKVAPVILDVSKFRVRPRILDLTIVSTSPLIVHQFSAKAQKKILVKQTGEAQAPREKKDPFLDFVDSLYIIDPRRAKKLPRISAGDSWPFVEKTFGFPAPAFKQLMISTCSFVEGIAPKVVKAAVHILGELIPIEYRRLIMRQDTVNNKTRFGRKIADVRFRGEFQDWQMYLQVSYDERLITPDQIGLLIGNGGYYVGIGENRPGSPEKPGNHGMFAIGD